MEMTRIKITVRDGRAGRDRTLDDAEGGQILDEFESDMHLRLRDALTLPDGSEVTVIGGRDYMVAKTWHQTVIVGIRRAEPN